MNESVISGSEDLQPSSLECTDTAKKYIGTSMDEFFDSHPLPTNINEVDCQSNGKPSTFCVQLNQLTSKGRSLTHWTTLTVFGITIEWSKISIEWSLTFLLPSFSEKDECKLCPSLFV